MQGVSVVSALPFLPPPGAAGGSGMGSSLRDYSRSPDSSLPKEAPAWTAAGRPLLRVPSVPDQRSPGTHVA